MSVIFIQTVFDADQIWTRYQNDLNRGNSANNPREIGHEDVFMVTSPVYLQDPNTQATWNLSIRAEMGDEVRWAGVTVSDEIKYSVIIYNIILNKYAPPTNKLVTSLPIPKIAHPFVPVPKESGGVVYPLDCDFKQIPEYYLSSDIIDYGTENYSVQFFITEGERTLAYFQYDPSITVSPLG